MNLVQMGQVRFEYHEIWHNMHGQSGFWIKQDCLVNPLICLPDQCLQTADIRHV